jgi:hypothetical protein
VHWDTLNESRDPKVSNLHVTAFYWPENTPAKKALLDAFDGWPGLYKGYTIVKVDDVAAFGPARDYPVLTLKKGYHWYGFTNQHNTLKNALGNSGLDTYDKSFEFNPHCTVDLATLLDPPKRLIIGPPELWYKDDEPVAI